METFFLAIITCFLVTLLMTPLIKKLAFMIKAVDLPNERKIHTNIMPRLGGLAIYISFCFGLMLFLPDSPFFWPILIGCSIIVMVGILDDIFQLTPIVKLIGQLFAAIIIILGGIQIDFITLPFGPKIELGMWGILITILWILLVTNAINFIDGLDGLATGVSAIVLMTISFMSFVHGNFLVALMSLMLLGAAIAFLYFNFYPAKIFLGDSGSNFFGFMISIFSILGLFKNVTMFSIIIPIVILGVPFVDTLFAIIRRIVKGTPVYKPDKFHLHHCLIKLGFTHRQTVFILYGMSMLFSISAIIFSRTTVWGSFIMFVLLAVLVELIVEVTGLISQQYRPILNILEKRKI